MGGRTSSDDAVVCPTCSWLDRQLRRDRIVRDCSSRMWMDFLRTVSVFVCLACPSAAGLIASGFSRK